MVAMGSGFKLKNVLKNIFRPKDLSGKKASA